MGSSITIRFLGAVALCTALAACDKPDNAPGPGGVTMGEAKALDDAAQMIEARRLPPEILSGAPQAAPQTAAPATQPPPRQN